MLHGKTRVLIAVMLVVLVFGQGLVLACPTCKEGLAANDPTHTSMVRGYFWSIVFMMSMPFLILAGISGYFYLEVRRARARVALGGPVSGWQATPLRQVSRLPA